jgi:SpoVK/Ycf46/Vps4 family AAA+-type ATPase
MDDNSKQLTDLVHLARLALTGRRQDVQLYIRRIAKKYQQERPAIGEQLGTLLRESPTPAAPLRDAGIASVPVDSDSRLQLLRCEHEPVLDVEPIWAEQVKAGLEQLIAERRGEARLQEVGLTPTRSALFTGPPGVGKSLAARWIARELGHPLLTLDLSAVMSSFLGRTGTNLRNVIDYAKSVDCVLLLDEFDAVAKRRDDLVEMGELKRLVTVLLQEIDDWPTTGLLIAATNHPTLLDPAAWRRFDVHISFPMPDDAHAIAAVKAFLGPTEICSRHLIHALAIALRESSFSDIERELTQARRASVIQDQPLADYLEQIVRSFAKSLARGERYRLAALLAESLPQRRVTEITGVSRDTIRKTAGKQ